MPLHRMNSVTIGVPNVDETREFYRDFNLTEDESAPGEFATADGGTQLRIAHAPIRRLLELNVGAENPDDLDRVASQLASLDVEVVRADGSLSAVDPGTGVKVSVEIAPAISQNKELATPYNGPGRIDRDGRAPKIQIDDGPGAKPRKLGHAVIGTTELERSRIY